MEGRCNELVGDMDELVARARSERDPAMRRALKEQYDALHDEWSAVKSELTAAKEVQANAVRGIVGTFRTLGAEHGKHASDYFDLSGATAAVRKMVEDALPFVPRDWLNTMRAAGVRVETLAEPRRSSRRNQPPPRSYFSPTTNTIYIARGKDKLTVVHEMMHAMDEHSQAFFDDSHDFFVRRTRGKQLRRLANTDPTRNYGPREQAFDMDGHCVSPYAYKRYADTVTGDLYAFEVSSVGVEYLYRNPLSFAADPDHLAFVLHKLREV